MQPRTQFRTPEIQSCDLAELIELAARVGADPLLTQGSAGNCSQKEDGVLWIKASGKWMAEANSPGFLMPLDLGLTQALVASGRDPASEFSGVSVETSLHAVMPHKVVLHVHSVNAIAWAVREDAPAQLARPMTGMNWCWVPYLPSGLPLAGAIGRALASVSGANVFILANHGLVVCGGSCGEVEARLREVESRLAIPPRPFHPADYAVLAGLADGRSGWELPDDDCLHAMATEPAASKILSLGLLFPAQAMLAHFHWPDTYRGISAGEIRDAGEQMLARVRGCGVLLNSRITAAEAAMLRCLAEVLLRLPSNARVHYLPEHELNGEIRESVARYREVATLNLRQ